MARARTTTAVVNRTSRTPTLVVETSHPRQAEQSQHLRRGHLLRAPEAPAGIPVQCLGLYENSSAADGVSREFAALSPQVPIFDSDHGARGQTRFVPDPEGAGAGGPVGSITIADGPPLERCFGLVEEMKHAVDIAKGGFISPKGLSQKEYISRMKDLEANAGILLSQVQTELIRAGVDGAAQLTNPLLETYQRATAAGMSESRLRQLIGDRKAQLQVDWAVDGSPVTYMNEWQSWWHAKNGGP